ncbi:MAG: transketolase [Magnetococcales bacterium]|nr:transketolase [Magnetococcales bacterium]
MDDRSRHLRKMVLRAMEKGGRGHLGSAFSLIEILRVLYDDVLRVRPAEPDWPDRDRCILSKGHGCLALYAILADKAFFPGEALDSFCRFDSFLGGHPERGRIPGVEASTGALGHGLSIGVGMALAARLKNKSHRVVVILGDGESNEGSVWEAAMAAAKHRLDNLITLVDCNGMQSYGPTREVLDMAPMAEKWRAFGCETREVNGHDLATLRATLTTPPAAEKPLTILCHTIKGKGIGLVENNADWHHKSKLAPDLLASLYGALEA